MREGVERPIIQVNVEINGSTKICEDAVIIVEGVAVLANNLTCQSTNVFIESLKVVVDVVVNESVESDI